VILFSVLGALTQQMGTDAVIRFTWARPGRRDWTTKYIQASEDIEVKCK